MTPRAWKKPAAALLLLSAALYAALRLTPISRELTQPPPASTQFLDRNATPLRTLLVDDRRFSRPITLAEISPQLVAATISAEDKRFHSHPGADPLALAAAAWSFLRGEAPRGASTITQQLVKIATTSPAQERTLAGKLRETWLALALERRWSKQRILEEYLNRLDYGNLQAGIASASHYYFAKPPCDLSAAESALLAALPKAPARLNPLRHAEEARARQQWVLHRMAANCQLDADALERARSEPLRWRPRGRDFEAPHFVDLLLQRRGVMAASGEQIQTTLDLELNKLAARLLSENLAALTDQHATDGAVVVLENRSGEVLALTGPAGATFAAGAGEVNMAWSIRSPGSAMKPFTYLLALERGANPCTVVPDVPTGFPTDTGIYRPNNYNHRFYGPVSLRFALGNSLNVAAIRALELAGGPEALQRAMQRAGVTTLHHPTEYYGLGLTLGNGEVRLLELANAYATLARLGVHRPFRMLKESAGALDPGVRVFDESACLALAGMLSDNAARAASFGTSSWLSFDFPVACKTGTSSDYRDNWAMGYTPEFTVGVWVGNADGSKMHGITGVTGAAPVMHQIFEHLHRTHQVTWYNQGEPRAYEIDPLTGRRAPSGYAARAEKCLHPPEAARAEDHDAEGRNVLPAEYAEWLAGPQNHLGEAVVGAQSATDLRILAPGAGSSYFLDGDLPANAQWIALRAEGQGELEWSSPTLAVQREGSVFRAQMREGRHTLLAREAATGRQVETWIEVKRW